MTRDELLRILNYEIGLGETNGTATDLWPHYALRAVVELHETSPDGKYCYGCFELSHGALYPTYPCLHIQAIERELR